MSIDEKIDLLLKEVAELKAHLVPAAPIYPVGTYRCEHEYPSNWNSTGLPSCTKCNEPYVYQGR